MLAQIAASGLEVVRLRGAPASAVEDLARVECWRYDDMHESPVVVDELEVAVRLDGATCGADGSSWAAGERQLRARRR